MIKKILSALMWRLLILEIHIRGPRLKNKSWRKKLQAYAPKYHRTFPIFISFLVDERRKAAYLNMPKAAGTSLMRTLLESEVMRKKFDQVRSENKQIKALGRLNWLIADAQASDLFPINMEIIRHTTEGWVLIGRDKKGSFAHQSIASGEMNSYFTFTFVRNPFSRFVSFFRDKYRYKAFRHRDGRYYSTLHVFFWLIEISSFADLTRKVSRLPDFHLDEHSAPQYLKLDSLEALGVRVNFIGKFETLEQDFEKIRKRFNLLPLEHDNRSSGAHEDWRDYYTPQTAKMVYQRYRRDFEMFGYEDEYPKLLDYLASKSIKPHHE